MKRTPVVRPRIRIALGDIILMGPGKADLLDAIRRTGSIRDAAAELGMSYMRAWGLVKTMNEVFREPLVESLRGGISRGGASLTTFGRRVLALYRDMEKKSREAIKESSRELMKLVRK